MLKSLVRSENRGRVSKRKERRGTDRLDVVRGCGHERSREKKEEKKKKKVTNVGKSVSRKKKIAIEPNSSTIDDIIKDRGREGGEGGSD